MPYTHTHIHTHTRTHTHAHIHTHIHTHTHTYTYTHTHIHTVLAYSHDDIHNLGHSMTDFMNVWAMLWLSGMSPHTKDITFLNIDAIRMGHSYKDELGTFGKHYSTAFARILTAKDFASRDRPTVCFKRLIMQPRPLVLFTWDGWWQDMKCTFLGPSSLFQRWNIQVCITIIDTITHNYTQIYTNIIYTIIYTIIIHKYTPYTH
jgi:hypothetical protein